MFTQPASLSGFVAENIGNRIPAQWKTKLATFSRHHSREGRRHFRTKSNASVATVFEGESLLVNDLCSRFFRIDLSWFQDGGAVLLIAKSFHRLSPNIKNIVLYELILRIEVSNPLIRRCIQL
jgi:hypothetical protein